MTTVLKLGGSVVTRKESPETLDEAAIEEAAAAVAEARDDVVLVHGGGSFGHHYADRHGVSTTDGTHDAAAVRDVHGAMTRLNDAVVDALARAGVSALPVHPLSLAHRTADGDLRMAAEGVASMLAEGFTPVLHGDVVVHADAGATIVSGDELVVELAEGLDAARVGLCSTVPGVLDTDGDVIGRIDAFTEVADALGASDTTDVTGGMAAKVEALLGLRAPAAVFGPEDLSAFLGGETPGTVVDGHTDR
ncbi:isopentenyl phosphate kinase [Halorientalis litorea]|jgi:isopentenyl phosphate kinase|uniref:isopentenyl phosphate kinase n=1 Tax=Halorientalis litorea TaxID=2931977 RepID=UPI001FF53F56|nr:isopentenyl phosphate kinase [Halorientalis litorea]